MFKTIKEEHVEAEIVEKKSKFIANIFYVNTTEMAEDIIKKTNKKYFDARHNCYAYSIKNINENGILGGNPLIPFCYSTILFSSTTLFTSLSTSFFISAFFLSSFAFSVSKESIKTAVVIMVLVSILILRSSELTHLSPKVFLSL